MAKTKRYFFHVTTDDWGDRVLLCPLDSDSDCISGRNYTEPADARICVSPTVAQCFSAIRYKDWCCYSDNYFVYRTKHKVTSQPPREVSDSTVTGERWLIKKILFVKRGTISADVIDRFPEPPFSLGIGLKSVLDQQRKKLRRIENILAEAGLIF